MCLSDIAIADMARRSKILADPVQYLDIYRSVKEIATSAFPECDSIQVDFLGARMIGVGLESYSLDIFVKIDGKNFKYLADKDNEHVHENIFNKLITGLNKSSDWEVKNCLSPLIFCVFSSKLTSRLTSCEWQHWSPVETILTNLFSFVVKGTINTLNDMAVRNSQVLAYMLGSQQPEAVKLLLFIKQWLKVQDVKGFSSYAVTLLVVFFLQTNKLMPLGHQVTRRKVEEIGKFHIELSSTVKLATH